VKERRKRERGNKEGGRKEEGRGTFRSLENIPVST